MNITLKQPLALYEAGTQPLNEDFIFPLHTQANPEERLFVVCDGTGGPNAGDVASKLVALSFAKYFASHPPRGEVDQAYLDGALNTAEEALTAYKEAHPESKEMATTLAMLYMGDTRFSIAWVGNSQVYHYSHKQKKLNHITGNQPEGHVQTLVSGSDQPQSIHTHSLSFEDVGPKDYLLLATDGITTRLSAEGFQELVEAEDGSNADQLLLAIREKVATDNPDNYACYLLQVDQLTSGQGAVSGAATAATAAAGATVTDQEKAPGASENRAWIQRPAFWFAVAFLGILSIIGLSMLKKEGNTNTYANYIIVGDQLMADEKYKDARDAYQQAYELADSDLERSKADRKRQEAQEKTSAVAMTEDLPLSLEQYVETGKEFFDKQNYRDAVIAWENAQRKASEINGGDTLIPLARLAEAYVRLGSERYGATPPDYTAALEYFDKADELLESPEVALGDVDLQKLFEAQRQTTRMSLARAAEADGNLGTDAASSIADNSGSGTRSRGLAPAGSNARKAAPASSNTPTGKTDAQPATSGSSTKANARVAPTPSALGTEGLSAEEITAYKLELSTGKRLYSQAKENGSAYEYKQSAAKLEAAGPMLDGAGAYLLSYMYHSGLGVDRDTNKALRYAQVSARRNWPAGQYYYGFLLLERKNPRDTTTAIQSLTYAANNNYLDAVQLLQVIR